MEEGQGWQELSSPRWNLRVRGDHILLSQLCTPYLQRCNIHADTVGSNIYRYSNVHLTYHEKQIDKYSNVQQYTVHLTYHSKYSNRHAE